MKTAFSIRNIYGDHMVLQRNKPVVIAGEATPGLQVAGTFRDETRRTLARADGTWRLEFQAKAEGGPFELSVCAQNSTPVVFRDILVGDVWYSSGQSNMEFFVVCDNYFYSLRDGREVAAAAHDPGLRLFQVPHGIAPDGPCDTAPQGGSWQVACDNPAGVGNFSAVAYWFGATLRKRLGGKVPIGLVNGSWGGTLIEPWISREAFAKAGFSKELALADAGAKPSGEILDIEDYDEAIARAESECRATLDKWLREKFFATNPRRSEEALREWAAPDFDDSGWTACPGRNVNGLKSVGVTWIRIAFDIPEEMAGKRLVFHSDRIDDCDETFIDGVKIGQTLTDVPQYWIQPRDYQAGTLSAGRHVLALRVQNHRGIGSVQGQLSISYPGSPLIVNLAECPWKECTEFTVDPNWAGARPPAPGSDESEWANCQRPTTLYNAMVNPFAAMNICGVIWYQGCSNFADPQGYMALQHLQIDSWRRAWRDPSMPFIITQLSAYDTHHPDCRSPDDFWKNEEPGTNPGYAFFREMQEVFLEKPATGVACTIDIGDHSDIHPANKKDVGIRLAHEAMRLHYGDPASIPGPRLREAVREGNGIRVKFANVGAGLEIRGGEFRPHLFAIAGADGRFVWAKARLDPDDTVFVWSDDVAEPTDVQYAFTAYPPEANLNRKGDGLPVFPFRTNRPDWLKHCPCA